MRRKKSGSCDWLEYEIFDTFPQIVQGTLLRGSDQKDWGLKENAYLRQQHGIESFTVFEKGLQGEGDIMMTRKKDVTLSIFHADCQAAIIFDPKQEAICALHAGWRGQVQGVYEKAITEMQKLFGSNPEDLHVAISPSLGPKNSEFIHYEKELPHTFWQFRISETYFDLWAIALWQLMSKGVQKEKIQIASLCTLEDPSCFFSYRRDKKKGYDAQHTTIIGLRS
ncbi:MAG: polyphenol oxidase family protein [Chlamydiae bacterium]|nr:polyphenol oxidase family protein [Chlamydiota bacterium]